MDDKVQFSWCNGAGEHACTGFDRMVDAYWRKVAQPAIAAAEQEVQTWLAAAASDSSAIFVHSDREIQYQVTALGLCLSLQALWERQLRRYLGEYVSHDPGQMHVDLACLFFQFNEHRAVGRRRPLPHRHQTAAARRA